MKREFLQNFKVGDQTLPKEIIDAILDENSRDIEATKGKFGDYDAIKQQLAEANQTIEGFKAMDIEGVRAAAEEWKQKAQQAEAAANAKIADLEFEHQLSAAIAGAKGRNAKAIAALLDVEALKGSKNRDADIKAALEGLKQDSGYLFDGTQAPPPYAPGTGSTQMLGTVDKTLFAKMGYRERLELKKNDPKTYESLKE